MELLVWLYSLTGIVAALGYLPQIISLWRRNGASSAQVSLAAFATWTLSGIITFSYATLVSHDPYFMFCAGVNMTGSFMVTVLMVRRMTAEGHSLSPAEPMAEVMLAEPQMGESVTLADGAFPAAGDAIRP